MNITMPETNFYDDEIIKEKILEEELEKNFFLISCIDAENERKEEEEYIQNTIKHHEEAIARSNVPFVPSIWENSPEQLPRDMYKLYQMGKLNLIDFYKTLRKWGVMSHDELAELFHEYLEYVECDEAMNQIEEKFHKSWRC